MQKGYENLISQSPEGTIRFFVSECQNCNLFGDKVSNAELDRAYPLELR